MYCERYELLQGRVGEHYSSSLKWFITFLQAVRLPGWQEAVPKEHHSTITDLLIQGRGKQINCAAVPRQQDLAHCRERLICTLDTGKGRMIVNRFEVFHFDDISCDARLLIQRECNITHEIFHELRIFICTLRHEFFVGAFQ